MVYIETDRLLLRDWKDSDKAIFSVMNGSRSVMKYFPSVMSAAESDAFVGRIVAEIADNGYGLFAVELKETGEFIGYVGFHRFCFEVPFAPGWEIGWRLADRYWHHGYATEAAKACMSYAKAKRWFKCVYSFTAVPNKPSERVMQRIGMQYCGRFMHPVLPDGHWLKEHVLYKIELQ